VVEKVSTTAVRLVVPLSAPAGASVTLSWVMFVEISRLLTESDRLSMAALREI
jgi:hypothetical protein